MNIVFILPRGPLYRYKKGIFKKNLQYAPLTLTTLASLVPAELNAHISIIDEGIEEIPSEINADLVCISAITGSVNRAYVIADALREKGITVVLGGVHPTLMPFEAQQHADSVVVGFAEKTFPQLLNDFRHQRLQKFYMQHDEISLDNLPHPRRDLLKLDRYIISETVQATRGCINNCDFCVVPVAWKRMMYFRPVHEVIEEIERLPGREFLFLDVSPIENKEYAKKLMRALIPLKKKWASPLTIKITKDQELFNLAVKSGCRAVLIGFESVNETTIKGIGKGFNIVEEYRQSIQQLHDHNIAIMGCFVFGCDTDDTSVFKRTVDFVIENNIDLPRYTTYTPFPGTPLYNRLAQDERIVERNWDYYDGQHVVFKPARMSQQQLREGIHWAWENSYSFSSIYKRLSRSGCSVAISIAANLGYRFYAKKLSQYERM